MVSSLELCDWCLMSSSTVLSCLFYSFVFSCTYWQDINDDENWGLAVLRLQPPVLHFVHNIWFAGNHLACLSLGWHALRYVRGGLAFHVLFADTLKPLSFRIYISKSDIILPLILILLAISVQAATVAPLVWATVLAVPPWVVAFELLNHASGVKAAKNETTIMVKFHTYSQVFLRVSDRTSYPSQKLVGDSMA